MFKLKLLDLDLAFLVISFLGRLVFQLLRQTMAKKVPEDIGVEAV